MINVLLGDFLVMKLIPLYTKKKAKPAFSESKKGFPGFPGE